MIEPQAPYVRVVLAVPADGAGLDQLAERIAALSGDWVTLGLAMGSVGTDHRSHLGAMVLAAEAWHADLEGHVVTVDTDGGWAIQHPLTCRPDLLACTVHLATNDLMALGPHGAHALGPGRYRVAWDDHLEHGPGYTYERVVA